MVSGTIIFCVLLVLIIMSISSVLRLRRFKGKMYTPYTPAVSVVVPCKGDDGTLLTNLDGLVDQAYPNIEYIFVTATDDDAACKVFEVLKQKHPHRRIKSAVAGIPVTCSQQNNNQKKGVEVADPHSEIIVIVDSDGIPDKHFIAHLVAPLQDHAIGASSGYRWYEPRWNHLPDILRTVWNAGGFAFLVNPTTSFVWGGAMAFRRKTYEDAGIASVWGSALSDDMTLSRVLKGRGLKLVFVPECIVISEAKDTWYSLVHWTNRQTLVTRFYNKSFWIGAAIFHVLGNVLGISMLIVGFAGSRSALIVGLLWFVHFWIFAYLMSAPLERLLLPRGLSLGRKKFLLVLVAPLASILQGINSINSFFTRKIRWAGVIYYIKDHEHMRVI